MKYSILKKIVDLKKQKKEFAIVTNLKNSNSIVYKLDEDLDEAWIELAILYGESQKLFEATEHVKKALSLDPENPDYYLIAYDLYQRLGLFIEGEKMLKLVLKFLRSEKPQGLFDYVKTLQKINQNSAAEKVLEIGIEIGGGYNILDIVKNILSTKLHIAIQVLRHGLLKRVVQH